MWLTTGFWCAAAAVVALSSPVSADSLGFRFADISFGATQRGDDLTAQSQGILDFAITDVHGVQLDLAVVGYPGEFLGQLDAHLYMMPTDIAKYGLFGSLADMNGREATIAMVGIEAIFALSGQTEVHGRAGLGMAMPGNMDFITASLGASHAFTTQLAVFGDLTVTEIDEASLRAVATSARLGARYQPDGKAWEVSASLVRDGLSGRDAAPFETRAELGITLHLGAWGGAERSLASRAFTNPQPFDPLLRRGMF